MNKQQPQLKEKQTSIKQIDSSRDGFQPNPATAELDGASGGNEPTGRTAVEVMDYYAVEEMQVHANEEDNTVNSPATSKEVFFNPVLDSLSEITEK